MQRLGFAPLLACKPCPERDLICAMVASRIVCPTPKFASTRAWGTSLVITNNLSFSEWSSVYGLNIQLALTLRTSNLSIHKIWVDNDKDIFLTGCTAMKDELKSNNPHNDLSELIRWKTDAWRDPRMVNWYSGRMIQSESTNHLKNAVEIATIKQFISGPQVLDIGVGTGRAALPLVADGYQLTGIDSSQAMLDETRRLAGDAPIELKVGDLTELPCEDHTFDSAVALNVLVHFPSWQKSLIEWKRVVKPGGRLIFDIHSRDHVVAAYGLDRDRWPQALQRTEDTTNFTYYMSRISVNELHSFADESGFSIAAVIPYGAFFGGGNVNWLMYEELESKNHWKRTLSWFARDQRLLELGIFLEDFIISRLTPRMTGRMFVVLDNKPDPKGNARLIDDIKSRDATLDEGDLASLIRILPLTPDQYRTEFERLLKPLRSRYFLYMLYSRLISRMPQLDLINILPKDVITQFHSWQNNENIDFQAVEIARNWAAGSESRFKHGVDITFGSQYGLVKALLTKHFKLFAGGDQ